MGNFLVPRRVHAPDRVGNAFHLEAYLSSSARREFATMVSVTLAQHGGDVSLDKAKRGFKLM